MALNFIRLRLSERRKAKNARLEAEANKKMDKNVNVDLDDKNDDKTVIEDTSGSTIHNLSGYFENHHSDHRLGGSN